MKKIIAAVLNLILFAIMLVAVAFVTVLLISYVDIIFTVAVEESDAGYIASMLWIVISVYLYFVYIRRKGGALVGSAVAGTAGHGVGFRPLCIYLALVGVAVVFYGMAVLINEYVFGSMAERERAAVMSYGVTTDWKSFYSNIEYNDPENAAFYMRDAEKLFKGVDHREVEALWKVVTGDKEYDRGKISADIKKLLEKDLKLAEAIDKALEHKKFLWDDPKPKGEYDVMKVEIPSFSLMRTYVYIKMIGAVSAANSGDWVAARTEVSRAISMVNLLENEPFLLGYLIRIANARIVYSGLVAVVKAAKDKDVALEVVKDSIRDIRSLKGSFAKVVFQECSFSVMMMDVMDKGVPLGEGVEFAMGFSMERYLRYPYYRLFSEWNNYLLLRGIGFTIRNLNELDMKKMRDSEAVLKEFYSKHMSLPAFVATAAVPSLFSYFVRELLMESERNVMFLFASVVHYKSKYGKYPESLDKLVPVYMKELPVNPINGKPYIYIRPPAIIWR